MSVCRHRLSDRAMSAVLCLWLVRLQKRTPGPEFKKADPEKIKMDRMLAGMEEQGMRGNMYTRDEAIQKYMSEQAAGAGEDGLCGAHWRPML